MWPLDHNRAAPTSPITCQLVYETEEPDKREMLLAPDISTTRYAESQPVN